MARGYAGPADPEKGQPHRHTRAKISLLMQDIEGGHLALKTLVLKIAEKRPEEVLDALIWLTETNQEVT